MASLATNFTQPTEPVDLFNNPTRRMTLVGDPVIGRDNIIYFVGYGLYYVVAPVATEGSLVRDYDVRFIGRYGGAPNVIPIGTQAILEAEGVTHSELPYSAVIALNFKERDYRTLTLTGDITFNAQKHEPAKSIVVKIRNSSGVTSRNLVFPPSWIFIGPAGRPSTIAPSRTGILSITCFGTSDADVIAAWAVQA